jgi:hypothetical protein
MKGCTVRGRAFAVPIAILGLGSAPLAAQLVGPEFLVNSYTTNYQASPAVARSGDGGFVVVWDSIQDGTATDVYGQRFDGAGAPVGGEFQVNFQTQYAQGRAAVASDGTNGFVVAWTSFQQEGPSGGAGVYAQRFDSAGNPIAGEFAVNSYTTGDQTHVAVAVDPAGNTAVVWTSNPQDGSNAGVYRQLFDSAGGLLGGEEPLNQFTTNYQWRPDVAADGLGNFIATWQSVGQDGSQEAIVARRFDATGASTAEFVVNQYTTGPQVTPSVAADANGNFVVAWVRGSEYTSSQGIYARRFDVNGVATGDETRLDEALDPVTYKPRVSADPDGGFLVVWESQDVSNLGVFARRLDGEGAPVGGAFRVNSFTEGAQRRPAVAALDSGEFVVAWTSGFQASLSDDVFAQRVGNVLFFDNFESGGICHWSLATGGACP